MLGEADGEALGDILSLPAGTAAATVSPITAALVTVEREYSARIGIRDQGEWESSTLLYTPARALPSLSGFGTYTEIAEKGELSGAAPSHAREISY